MAEELRSRGHRPLLLISRKKVDAEASAKYGGLEFETVPAIAKPRTLSLRVVPDATSPGSIRFPGLFVTAAATAFASLRPWTTGPAQRSSESLRDWAPSLVSSRTR